MREINKNFRKVTSFLVVIILLVSLFAIVGVSEDDDVDWEAPDEPERPEDGASTVPTQNVELAVEVTGPENEWMTVYFYGGEENQSKEYFDEIDTVEDVREGDEASVTWKGRNYGDTYEWYVELEDEDGNVQESDTWEFTLIEWEVPEEPVSPEDGADEVTTRDTELAVEVTHPEDYDMSVNFYAGTDVTDVRGEPVGSISPVESGELVIFEWDKILDYDTTYYWYVELVDNGNVQEAPEWEGEMEKLWSFETKSFPTPDLDYPEDDAEGVEIYHDGDMDTRLAVKVDHPEGEDMNIHFYGGEEDEDKRHIDTFEEVESGEEASIRWEGLNYGTNYEWYIEVEEIEIQNGKITFDSWTFETEHIPNKPRERDISPGKRVEESEDIPEEAKDITANPELEVTVRHPEGEDMWVQFYGAEKGESKDYLWTEEAESGDTVSFTWEELNYDTTYEWYVELIEDTEDQSNITVSDPWSFETKSFTPPEDPEYPEADAEGVEIYHDGDMDTELTVKVEHPEGESLDVTFYDGENQEIGQETDVESGEEASVRWEGLDYGTNYEWYVIIVDEVGRSRKSRTWQFETEHIPNKPREGDIWPENEAEDITANPELEVTVRHPEGEDMLVQFYGAEKGEDMIHLETKSVESGEIATADFTSWAEENYDFLELKYDTTYEWEVRVEEDKDDPKETVSEVFSFETKRFLTPIYPEYPEHFRPALDEGFGIKIGEERETELRVVVEHPEDEDLNVKFYGRERGEELEPIGNKVVESGDEATMLWPDPMGGSSAPLRYGTFYEWYIEVEDEVGRKRDSRDRDPPLWEFETEYIPNKIRNPEHPEDGEDDVEIDPEGVELAVKPTHPAGEGKRMTVEFYDGEDDEIIQSESVKHGETARVNWEDLDFSTEYEWYVEVKEGPDRTQSETWEFTTIDPETLTVDIDGNGRLEVDQREVRLPYTRGFNPGAEVTLNAIPDEDYEFGKWTRNLFSLEIVQYGDLLEEETVDPSLVTLFRQEGYTLDENAELFEVEEKWWDWSITENGEIAYGIVEEEEEFHIFGEYEDEEEITITMDEDKEFTAHIFVSLDVSIDGPGTVEVESYGKTVEEVEDEWSGNFMKGTEVTLIVDEVDDFEEWAGDVPEGEEKNEEITITMDDNKEITADFEEEVLLMPGFTSPLLLFAVFFAGMIYYRKKKKGWS